MYFQVIWYYLYDTKSGTDVGTMYHARQLLNARNVTHNPHDDFFAASDFVDTYAMSYIVAGALHHFGMQTMDDIPTKNQYVDNINKRDFTVQQSTSFIRQYILNPPVQIGSSASLRCKYCNKEYKKKAFLLKHESTHRDALQAESSKHK